jgi:transposase
MSTSILYHAFGTTSYRYLRTEFSEGDLLFYLEKKDRPRCSACASSDTVFDGYEAYTLRTLPIGLKRVFLVLYLHVVLCRACGARRQEEREVAEPRKTYTRSFARFVVDLSRVMTLADVARHLRVGWDLVKEIVRENLEKRARKRAWRNVKRIAIDEIAIRKGHRYMTVVLNLDTGEVLYAAEGKGKEALKAFFQRLRRAGAKLKAVVMDMSEAYLAAVKEYWPHRVAIVHDHYHIVANMNAVLDEIRRDEQNRLEGEGKQLIKGSRYLLLRASENLAQLPEKQARLDALLAVNATLHKAYLLKEDLRLFWKQPTKPEAKVFIKTWIAEALAMGNRHMTRFAKTVASRMRSILAWYRHPITSGPLEGLNNKIKVMKRMAYGYRDMTFFALRILFIHETKMELTGA